MVQEATAYQYYNKDAKCRTQVNVLDRLFPELPAQKYDVIYCDPLWDYGGKMQFDRSSTDKERFNPNGRKVFISSASFKYPKQWYSLTPYVKVEVMQI